ncbi:hypothetical protein ABFS83_07G010400 [Erythranthe nasuta]
MVQYLATLFNTLSKKNRILAKESKRNNQLMLTSSSDAVIMINPENRKNYGAGYSKRGKKGINNQDCFIIWEEFGCRDQDTVFCGVFDGHGPWGHLVSKTVRKSMPSTLLCNWQENVALNAHNNLDYGLGQENRGNIQFDMWKQSHYKTCADVDQELKQNPRIDSFYSGCTGLTLIRQGDLMIIANVGDSRAVLATTSDNGNLVAIQLSTDFKPNLPHESKRIAQSRGRVYSCPDEVGVHRLWMPKGDTVKGPGLALSRAFGDYYIKDFGLISEPEITQRNITSKDQFVVLATDGVWDVVTNQEAVEIVGATRGRAESAKRLVEFAVCAWKRNGRSAVMDDISAVCLFFHCS